MGNTPAALLRTSKVLMQGLDAAGKTTLLYQLTRGESFVPCPTLETNVEMLRLGQSTMEIRDCGGRDLSRGLIFKFFLRGAAAIVWVVDSTDRDRMRNDDSGPWGSSRHALHAALTEPELRTAVLLVLANKQDMSGAMAVDEVGETLGLAQLRLRPWRIFGCSAKTGEGLREAFAWLAETIKQQPDPEGELIRKAQANALPTVTKLIAPPAGSTKAMDAISSETIGAAQP